MAVRRAKNAKSPAEGKKPAAVKRAGSRLFAHVEVLQNGATVAASQRPLSRLGTLALTSQVTGELALPHYPLPNGRVEFLQAGSANAARLVVDPQWEGLCSQQGTPRYFNAGERGGGREVLLHKGDYASIAHGDLRILVKIGPKKAKDRASGLKGTAPAYRPWIWKAFVTRPEERWTFLAGGLMATGIMAGVVTGLKSNHQRPPRSLVEIDEKYALSFVAPDHLRTSPEALQENLDRTQFTRSTIEFYESFVAMLMGWDGAEKKHLFPTTERQYQGLHKDVDDLVQDKFRQQTLVDEQQLRSESNGVLTIPTVVGETVDGSMLRVIDKIGVMHEGLRLNLDAKRIVSKAFPKDPAYDFEDYRSAKPGGHPQPKDEKFQEAMEVIASEIAGASDEQLLYMEAERLAGVALTKQKELTKARSADERLTPLGSKPLAMPEGVKYASYAKDLDFALADEKAYKLEGTEWGAPKRVEKPKEALVGEIDPSLIEKFIRQNRFQLQLCYELALRRNELASGTIEWRWRIDSRGSISDLALVSTAIRDPKLVDCIERKIMGWRFPRPRKGSIEVSYPFEFTPTKG